MVQGGAWPPAFRYLGCLAAQVRRTHTEPTMTEDPKTRRKVCENDEYFSKEDDLG